MRRNGAPATCQQGEPRLGWDPKFSGLPDAAHAVGAPSSGCFG